MRIGAIGAEDRTNLTLTTQLIENSRKSSSKLGKTKTMNSIMTFVNRLLSRLESSLITQSRNKPTTVVSLRRMKMLKKASSQVTKNLLKNCLRSVFLQLAGILNGRSMISSSQPSKAQVKRMKYFKRRLFYLRSILKNTCIPTRQHGRNGQKKKRKNDTTQFHKKKDKINCTQEMMNQLELRKVQFP